MGKTWRKRGSGGNVLRERGSGEEAEKWKDGRQ